MPKPDPIEQIKAHFKQLGLPKHQIDNHLAHLHALERRKKSREGKKVVRIRLKDRS